MMEEFLRGLRPKLSSEDGDDEEDICSVVVRDCFCVRVCGQF